MNYESNKNLVMTHGTAVTIRILLYASLAKLYLVPSPCFLRKEAVLMWQQKVYTESLLVIWSNGFHTFEPIKANKDIVQLSSSQER